MAIHERRERDELARIEGKNANYIFLQQSWVCRHTQLGVLSQMPTWHGELWVAGLYVAMIQLGGGVGSIVPENFIEYVVFFVCIVLAFASISLSSSGLSCISSKFCSSWSAICRAIGSFSNPKLGI